MSATLRQNLVAALATSRATGLCVAFSGGPDSTALLHVLAQIPEARARGLRALHVDHGLHAGSAGWADQCRALCRALDVPLTCVRVMVDDVQGEGLEAAARRARRAAFAREIRPGEWLALAHHRGDQVETVLLKLLRGAGPEGLGGMRELRPLAQGFVWRPLLETPREILVNYLIQNNIQAVDDPSNSDRHFARNALRHEILPRVARHWPNADASILHAARLCREAADHLRAEADAALARLAHPDSRLDATGWLALPKALRGLVLDAWLRGNDRTIPTDAQRLELERQAANATADAVPCVAWPDTEVRVWHGCLYATPPLEAPPTSWSAMWTGVPLALPAHGGTLTLEAMGGISPRDGIRRFDPPLGVRLRRGGERIKPVGDPHTRELRDLFQRARIPPWVRGRCPLIFEHDALIAVGGWWQSARGANLFAARGVHPAWLDPPWRRIAAEPHGSPAQASAASLNPEDRAPR